MKYSRSLPILFALGLLGCNQQKAQTTAVIKIDSVKVIKLVDPKNDLKEIETLIRKVVKQQGPGSSFDLLPAVVNNKDSTYIGFDLQKLKTNLETLKSSNLFSAKFIENYKQIILTIDKKTRNKEYPVWHMGELPNFAFANDADPWCDCQDVPYDTPDSHDYLEVEPIDLTADKGEMNWKWGNLQPGTSADWKAFRYRFDVEKENGQWRISYMEGFDYAKSIK